MKENKKCNDCEASNCNCKVKEINRVISERNKIVSQGKIVKK